MPPRRPLLNGRPPRRRTMTQDAAPEEAAAAQGGFPPPPAPAQAAEPTRPTLTPDAPLVTGGDQDVFADVDALQPNAPPPFPSGGTAQADSFGDTGNGRLIGTATQPPAATPTSPATPFAPSPGAAQGLTRPTRTMPEQDETGIGDSGPTSNVPLERQNNALARMTAPLGGNPQDGSEDAVQAILALLRRQRGGV